MNPVEHPAMVYVALLVGIVLLVSQAVPKVLGPLGTGLSDWSRQRREARIAAEDADMADVQRQVDYLTRKRREDREEHAREQRLWASRESRWRREWQAHRRWDYEMVEASLQHNIDPPALPPPPFMSPDPVTPAKGTPTVSEEE